MDDKTIWNLISVGFGWGLAQATIAIKSWWQGRGLLKGLLTELDDILEQLDRVELTHARQLKIYALGGIEGSASLPIQNMFFKQYYKDAFSYLSRSQRLSFQLIHSNLEALNDENKKLHEFNRVVIDNYVGEGVTNARKEDLEKWGIKVKQLYKSTMIIKWYIRYHLDHKEIPIYDINGPFHKSYIKYTEDLDKLVNSTIDEAKTFNREGFER